MKINAVSLNLNHGRTPSIEPKLILVAFSRGDVNKCAICDCFSHVAFFLTDMKIHTNVLHAAFIK